MWAKTARPVTFIIELMDLVSDDDRSGAPIEIVSKVILRHENLSTTQIYLGKVPGTEVMRWIENLYA